MNISERDRRALILLVVTVVVGTPLYFYVNRSSGSGVVAPSVSRVGPQMAQQRLTRLRQVAATVPVREAVLKQTSADLAVRERGIIQADTTAQAQAALVEIARRIGKDEQIDLRGGDFGAPKAVGRLWPGFRDGHVRLPHRTAGEFSGGPFEGAGACGALRTADHGGQSEREDDECAHRAGRSGGEKARAREERSGGILKAKLIALNVVLVAALGGIVWQGRNGWNEARKTRQDTVNVKVKTLPPPPIAPAPKPESDPATKFSDVATKDLFSKDRNPNVVVEAPKVEPPKPMPPLPIVYGVLGLPSGTKAIMSEKKGGPERPVREGDKVGEFLIASLDPQTVIFDWDGKRITKKIDDLIDRSGPPVEGAGQAAAPPASNAGAAPPRPAEANVKAGPGKDIGGGYRACVAGDTSAAGAIVDGYRKNVVKSPFGESCNWTQAQ